MSLSQLIAEHGALIYGVAFVWAFFEGETFVLLGGVAAARGEIDPFLLGLVAALGSFAGDQCWFQLGRRYGTRLLERFPRWRTRARLPLTLLERYDVLFILTFRFIYGIRNISSFALGLSRISWRRFSIFNFLGSALWSVSFVGVGYIAGGLLGLMLGDLMGDLGLVLLALFVLLLAGGLLFRRQKRPRRLARRRRYRTGFVRSEDRLG
jgi:membrane protein DedA with SNARE-associated domain